MDVVAVVRPGPAVDGAPDLLTPLGGVPMVAHAVARLLASGSVGRVVVLVSRARVEALAAVVAGPRVDVRALEAPATDALSPSDAAHGRQRPDGRCGDACATVVVVHDAARPLVPTSVVAAVVAAARAGHPVTVPVLPLTDTVKVVGDDGLVRGTPDRTALRVVQTPQAFRADLLGAALPAVLAAPAGRSYVAAGTPAHTVSGHPDALALRSAEDLRTAELLLAGEPG
jgi:2-C-methyl-D-erythritol 4-phosphate cytidylyltransferase